MSMDQATEAWLKEGKISSLPANESEMSETLTLVLLKYIGLPVTGPLGRALRAAFRLPARRFSRLAVEFDSIVAREGYRAGSAWVVSRFLPALEISGHELVRQSGPVLLVGNHPGTFDSFAVASSLPRDDFKAIARGYPFFRALPSASQHLIFSELDTHVRMATARKAIRHLREGGILLVFPSAGMDPDPSCIPGADAVLDTWSASPEVLLRAVPGAQVHVLGMSGFLESRNARNPLARLPRGQYERQIVAETFQMVGHLVFNRQIPHGPRVLFSPPYDVSALADGSGRVLPRIIQIAHETLAQVSPPTRPGF
jgi:hypothetical protein